MNSIQTIFFCIALALFTVPRVAHGQDSSAKVEIPGDYISVGDYSGTANERIEAAIAAAMATEHKTVFFPNGTYRLRGTVQLNRGTNTELHLVGESRKGVHLTADTQYLEAHYNGGNFKDGNGARLAHMINLSSATVFDSVDVSIQNMTLDMKSQSVYHKPVTYNVAGHGVRVGTGWREGRFKVNNLTIKNVGGYGIGIQDRHGHPKNNITLTHLHIERTGSDGIDTKNAGGEGSRNLIIRDVTVKDIGYTDRGYAAALDIRYRTVIIERVKLMSAGRRTLPDGKRNNIGGISFRPNGGVLNATVSDVYIKGFNTAINVHSSDEVAHQNIAISDFKIHDYAHSGIRVMGPRNSGHTISDGYVHSERGTALIVPEQGVTVRNVTEGPWPAGPDPSTQHQTVPHPTSP